MPYLILIEIAVGCLGTADTDTLVGKDVSLRSVGFGVYRNGGYSYFPAGADDAHGYFTVVGYKIFENIVCSFPFNCSARAR